MDALDEKVRKKKKNVKDSVIRGMIDVDLPKRRGKAIRIPRGMVDVTWRDVHEEQETLVYMDLKPRAAWDAAVDENGEEGHGHDDEDQAGERFERGDQERNGPRNDEESGEQMGVHEQDGKEQGDEEQYHDGQNEAQTGDYEVQDGDNGNWPDGGEGYEVGDICYLSASLRALTTVDVGRVMLAKVTCTV